MQQFLSVFLLSSAIIATSEKEKVPAHKNYRTGNFLVFSTSLSFQFSSEGKMNSRGSFFLLLEKGYENEDLWGEIIVN